MSEQNTNTDQKSKNSGRYWPIGLAVLLGAWVISDVVMLVKATNDPSFAVEEDYYKKAENWDAHAAQRETNRALGWRAVLTTTPGKSRAAPSNLNVVLIDKSGAPISGAAIAVKAFHNARAGNILTTDLTEAPDGSYAGSMVTSRPGLWEFRLHITRGDQVFTQIIRQEIGLSAAAPRSQIES